MLRSYNAHNDYVLGKTAFDSLHEEYYNKQIYDMLDELQVCDRSSYVGLRPHLHCHVIQAIQEDLVKGFAHSLKNGVEIQQDKVGCDACINSYNTARGIV